MTLSLVTAADAIYQIIVEDDPTLEELTFQGFTPDVSELVREINEGEGNPRHVFAAPVGVEGSVVEIGVRSSAGEYLEARNEALRLRYLIARKGTDYEFGGRKLMAALPAGGVEYLGRDAQRRSEFAIRFDCWMEAADDGND